MVVPSQCAQRCAQLDAPVALRELELLPAEAFHVEAVLPAVVVFFWQALASAAALQARKRAWRRPLNHRGEDQQSPPVATKAFPQFQPCSLKDAVCQGVSRCSAGLFGAEGRKEPLQLQWHFA